MNMYCTLWEKSGTFKLPPWLKALADAKVPWDALTPMATVCWLQRLSSCIELYSKSPFSARMQFLYHMLFGSQELISPFLFAPSCWAWESIKEVLRLPEMYVSEHICLTDLSLSSSCGGCNLLLVPTKVHSGALRFVQFGLENLVQTPKCLFRYFQVIHMFICFPTDRICLGHEGKYTI